MCYLTKTISNYMNILRRLQLVFVVCPKFGLVLELKLEWRRANWNIREARVRKRETTKGNNTAAATTIGCGGVRCLNLLSKFGCFQNWATITKKRGSTDNSHHQIEAQPMNCITKKRDSADSSHHQKEGLDQQI